MNAPDAITSDVLVRAWEPNLRQEGARFNAATIRRDITLRARVGDLLDGAEELTLPGLVIIAPSALPAAQNATDVCVAAIPSQIKFTILSTAEMIWFPVAAHKDAMQHWHIECIPFAEWLRIRLRTEPTLMGTPSGL